MKNMKKMMKTGAVLLFMAVLSLAGLQTPKVKADTINITQDGVYEYGEVQLEGHSYKAIWFEVKNYGTDQARVQIMGLHTQEEVIYIPSTIANIPVRSVGGENDYSTTENKYFKEQETNRVPFWTDDQTRKYKEVKIPNTVTRIESGCFDVVKINKMSVPESVTYIGGGSGLKQVTVKGKKTVIGRSAFARGRLEKITLPKDYQGKIEEGAFSGSDIKSFVWPVYTKKSMAKKIEESAFSSCKSLKKVVFPKKSKYIRIPQNCFYDCINLTKLTFPKGIKEVVYGFHVYADNYDDGPQKLIFKGKKTKLKGVKASNYLGSDAVVDIFSVNLKNKVLLSTGKIVAPKNSSAIRYAKKAYYIKNIKPINNWRTHGKKGFKLAKIKWSYSK